MRRGQNVEPIGQSGKSSCKPATMHIVFDDKLSRRPEIQFPLKR